MYSRILDKRLKSDYEIGFNATGEEAKVILNEARDFLEVITSYINLEIGKSIH